jgi:hypothetical protein
MPKYKLASMNKSLRGGAITPMIIKELGYKKVKIGEEVDVPNDVLETFLAKYGKHFIPSDKENSKDYKAQKDKMMHSVEKQKTMMPEPKKTSKASDDPLI